MARRNNAIPRFSLFSFQDIITCITAILILMTLLLSLDLAKRSDASPKAQTPRVVEQLSIDLEQLDAQIAALEEQVRTQNELLSSGALIDAASLRHHVEGSNDRIQQLQQDNERLDKQEARATAQQHQLEKAQSDRSSEKDEIRQLRERLADAQEKLNEMQSANRVFYNAASGSGRKPWIVQLDKRQILAAPAGVRQPPQKFSSGSDFLVWARGQRPTSQIHFVLLIKPDGIEEFDEIIDELYQLGFAVGIDALRADQQAIDPQTGASGP